MSRAGSTWLLAALLSPLALSACAFGGEDADRASPSAPPPSAEARAPTAAQVVARHRPAIVRALARDARCVAPACSAPEALRRRASAIAASVRPLDDALGRVPSPAAKNQRVATSVVRHAALQVRSCFLISARKHGGTPEIAECRGPVAEFHAAVAALRQRMAAPPA